MYKEFNDPVIAPSEPGRQAPCSRQRSDADMDRTSLLAQDLLGADLLNGQLHLLPGLNLRTVY